MYHMYREVIEKVPSFKDQHPDLLAMVVSNLRPEYYMTGDVLSCQGDPPEGMYIIGEGSIEVQSSSDQTDPILNPPGCHPTRPSFALTPLPTLPC